MNTIEHQTKRDLWQLRQMVMPDLVVGHALSPQNYFATERTSEELIARVDLDTLQIDVPIAVHSSQEVIDLAEEQDHVFEILHEVFDQIAGPFWNGQGYQTPPNGMLPLDCLELEDFVMIVYIRKRFASLGEMAAELRWLLGMERAVWAQDFEWEQ